MKSRLLITENEKSKIKSLYNISEISFKDDVYNKLMSLFTGDTKSKEGDKDEYDSTGISATSTGKVDISKGGFDGEQQKNISLLIDDMTKLGISNPNIQIGILSVISKECNFKPKGEISYAGTPNSRIRSIFGNRVSKLSESQLNDLKSNPKNFFNLVYASTVGNQGGEDGWNFRGRGFNQLTGRKNYEKYGSMVGENLVSDPDMLNKPEVASKVALAFFTKGKSPSTFPDFTDKIESAKYFADINAGGHTSSHRGSAIAAADKFSVKSDIT